MRRRRLVVGVLAGAAVATVAAALALRGPDGPAAATAARGRADVLPPVVRPAFVPGRPRPLRAIGSITYWASVRRATTARVAPDAGAAVVATVQTTTPEGTDQPVPVLGRAADPAGTRWVRIRIAVLPNGTTGWVPRSALGGYQTVRTRLDVDLAHLRATLYRNGRPLLRVPVGVGTAAAPTPRGQFIIRNRLTRYRSPAYGPVAFGTSARSATLTEWPAGGFVGIHGTDRPDLIPGRISHGCIRMRNADILELARRMPVGTPVRIF